MKKILRKPLKKKHRVTKSETFLVNQKYLGQEPPFKKGSKLEGSVLSNTYNWYNHMCEKDEARGYLRDYLYANNRKKEAKLLENVSDNYLPLTCCWIAHIITSGGVLPEQSLLYFERKLKETFQLHLSEKKQDNVEVTVARVSIQERITDKVNDFIGSIETLIDSGNTFSVYDVMQREEFPAKFAGRVVQYYQPVVDEYQLLLTGDDKDLNEGYKHLTAKQKKEKLNLFQQIIDDASRYGSNMKKIRKPRKKRVQSVEKKLKYFKYKVEDSSLKIASCNPSTIINAQEVWLYNTSQKQLTVLRAIDRGGLDIKRSSIVNYDDKNSVTKRAGRNLEDHLKSVMNGGKIVLRKLMDDISSQKIDISDRVGSNTIILRVIK